MTQDYCPDRDKDVYLSSPKQHKLHYYTHFDDVDLYYNLINIFKSPKPEWKKHYDKRKKEYNGWEFFVDDIKYVFKSKKGLVCRKNGKGNLLQNFEYTIQIHEEDKGLQKFYGVFSPRIKNTYYKDGNPFKLPHDEGVQIELDTTYYDMIEGQLHLKKLMDEIGVGKFFKSLNIKKGTIRQCEFYIRYDEKFEKRVAQVLKNIDELISFTTDEYSKVTRIKAQNQIKLFSLRSNRFDELGFFNNEQKWRYGLKTYRLKNDTNIQEGISIKNPKLEIYMDEKKKDDFLKLEYPELSDYSKLKETMFQIIGNIMLWASIKNNDLIGDNFFDPESKDKFQVREKKHAFQKLRNFYEGLAPEIKAEAREDNIRDFLRALVVNECMTYQQLMDSTAFGYDWVRKLTKRMEKLGIIKKIRSAKSFILFVNKKTAKVVEAIVKLFDIEQKDTKIKRKARLTTRIKNRFVAGLRRVEKLEVDIESKLGKVLKRFYLKHKDFDQIEISTFKLQEPKPPPDPHQNPMNDGLIVGF